MALDDYFANPSQDCLARLFDAVNSMDISHAPRLSRYEKIIMRTSERKDLFIEKYEDLMKPRPAEQHTASEHGHRTSDSVGSQASFEEGIMMRTREEKGKGRDEESQGPGSSTTSLQAQPNQPSPTDGSFSLDGSAVWVESGVDQSPHLPSSLGSAHTNSSRSASVRGRKSTDASSTSSVPGRRDSGAQTPGPNPAVPVLKDTHFFPATITYNDHQLPIRLPMYTFPEEVGDVSPPLSLTWLSLTELRARSTLLYNSCRRSPVRPRR